MALSEAASLPAGGPLPRDIIAPLTPSDIPGNCLKIIYLFKLKCIFILIEKRQLIQIYRKLWAENLNINQTAYALAGIGSNPSGFPLPGSGPAPAAGPSSDNPLSVPVQVSLSISGPSTLADIAQAMTASSPAAPGMELT